MLWSSNYQSFQPVFSYYFISSLLLHLYWALESQRVLWTGCVSCHALFIMFSQSTHIFGWEGNDLFFLMIVELQLAEPWGVWDVFIWWKQSKQVEFPSVMMLNYKHGKPHLLSAQAEKNYTNKENIYW